MSEQKQNEIQKEEYAPIAPERDLLLGKWRKLKAANKLDREQTPDALNKYKTESLWTHFRTTRMSYAEAIEACIRSEEEGVVAAFNLYKPRIDERTEIFKDFDKYIHLKMAFEMSYKQIFLYNNFNIAPFAAQRFAATIKNAFSEKNIDAFIAKTESEYKPYKNKKGRIVEKEEHVEKTLQKLRQGYKTRIIKAVKGAGMLFAAAKYVKNCRTLGIELDLNDFIERVKVIEHFELAIVSLKKQKGLFNLIDLARMTELQVNKNTKLRSYYLYDELGKGTETNEYRHIPAETLKRATTQFVKRTDILKSMRTTIDAFKFKK